MEKELKKLRVISIQNCPEINNFEKNKQKIEKLLYIYQSKPIDIIVLPEMCLTGYDLGDQETLEKSSEKQQQGSTFEFLQKLAIQHKSYVFGGYPEKTEDCFYNSLYCIDRKGDLVLNYRKTFLYEVDKKYYKEGDGFKTFELETLSNERLIVSPLICMDLNPWEFKEFELFESANFMKNNKVDLVIFCANWLQSSKKNDPYQLINYFAVRLSPMINELKSEKNKEEYKGFRFVCANRVGKEGEIIYGGSSCHLSLNPITLYKNLDCINEGIIYSEM